jgi:16S rRNA (uracil1498-N3)-methyltransferase
MDKGKLRNIELYYSAAPSGHPDKIKVYGEESRHLLKVMRHNIGDEVYITNGTGTIFRTLIKKTEKDITEAQIIDEYKFENELENIYFCIPKLKSPDRFETALEKCTELGITNFIIFDSERTVPKRNKTDRWKKIIISAMKQSLRSYLPVLVIIDSIKDIKTMEGKKILFSQEADKSFNKVSITNGLKYLFIFGPEGDFTADEMSMFSGEEFYNLGSYRLRSETAIIKCASML